MARKPRPGAKPPGKDPARPERTKQERLDGIGQAIGKYRQQAVQGRIGSGIEQIWREDIEFYEGIDDKNRGAQTQGSSYASKPPGQWAAGTNESIAFPNITAPYVDAAAATIGDILVPTDERAWSIKETPIPELIQKAKGGLPLEVIKGLASINATEEQALQVAEAEKQAAEAMIEEAKEKAKKAEKRIEDWHVEGQFHAEMRKVIDDSAKIGTGVLKGPVPVKKRQQMYRDDTLIIEEVIKPVSKRVDPRNVYPDPACGQNPHHGRFIFEREYLNRKQLEELKGDPDYLAEQIDLCLREGPSNREESRSTTDGSVLDDKELFEVWYYHGQVTTEDLETAGCTCAKEGEEPQPEKAMSACITLVNDRVIKANLNYLDTGEFPYDFFPWERRENSPWGKGIARKAREGQKIVVAATRAMLTNAGRAAGPVFVLRNGVKGADGKVDVVPWKIYYGASDDPTGDASKAIAMHVIPALTKDLMEIVRFGMDVAERETGMPMLLQGHMGQAPETLGGQQIVVNKATGVLRRLARAFDDCLTEPHVRRYYTYLLLYGEEDMEKGEFVIDARGSTVFAERAIFDAENAQILQASLNPAFGADPKKAFADYLRSRNRNPKEIQYTEEQLQEQAAQQGQQQPDPKVEASLKVAETRAKADVDRANITAQSDMEELKFKAAEAEKERSHQMRIAQLNRDMKIMELAQQEKLSISDIKAQLAGTAMKLRVQKDLSKNGKGPQVANPPTEPAGRAPHGQAYQR